MIITRGLTCWTASREQAVAPALPAEPPLHAELAGPRVDPDAWLPPLKQLALRFKPPAACTSEA